MSLTRCRHVTSTTRITGCLCVHMLVPAPQEHLRAHSQEAQDQGCPQGPNGARLFRYYHRCTQRVTQGMLFESGHRGQPRRCACREARARVHTQLRRRHGPSRRQERPAKAARSTPRPALGTPARAGGGGGGSRAAAVTRRSRAERSREGAGSRWRSRRPRDTGRWSRGAISSDAADPTFRSSRRRRRVGWRSCARAIARRPSASANPSSEGCLVRGA